jgi:hypothetical protein
VAKGSSRKHETRRANRDRRQRIEELRRQQRAAERRKNLLFAGSGILVAIILIAAAVVPAYLHDQAQKAKQKVGYQAAPTAAEKAAGCTGVHNDPISATAIHRANQAIDYSKSPYGDTRGGTPPIPPSSGPHNPIPLGDSVRFYPLSEKPRAERAVHNLEHGYVDVWYDSKLPAADVSKLQLLAQNPALSELLVVGWWEGDLPAGKHVVLTSWGRTERCARVSDTVIRDFYANHVNKLAPEVGAGTMGGARFAPDDLNTLVTPTASATATAAPTSKATSKSSGSPTPSPSK